MVSVVVYRSQSRQEVSSLSCGREREAGMKGSSRVVCLIVRTHQ